MRVIKHGNKYKQLIYTCKTCSCIYSVTEMEASYGILENYHANPNSPLKIGYECRCPECGFYNFVEETPEDVQHRIERVKELQKEMNEKNRGVINDVY